MLKATLTYGGDATRPQVTFALDCPDTVVGRGRPDILALPEVVDVVDVRQPLQVRRGDTLFVCIPETSLSRRHFCIRHATGEAGERVFLVRDLGSRCGIRVNAYFVYGEDEVRLMDGDSIRCCCSFVFNLVEVRDDSPDVRGPAVRGMPLLGQARITREDVDRILPGMSVADVRAILGGGNVVSRGESARRGEVGWEMDSTAVLDWQEGRRGVTVTFVNDRVLKVQDRGLGA